jgi:hypothetical protein
VGWFWRAFTLFSLAALGFAETPRFDFSTYFGSGVIFERIRVATDPAGSIYFAAMAFFEPRLPVVGGFQNQGPIYLAKIDPAARKLVYATYLGVQIGDQLAGMAVAKDGSVALAGSTTSTVFPLVRPLRADRGNQGTAFVMKIDPTGSRVVFSTYWGGSDGNSAESIALDAGGAIYVGGRTDSPDFPVTPGAFSTRFAGRSDSYVTKFRPDGQSIEWSTFLGGFFGAYGLAVDSQGSAAVLLTAPTSIGPTGVIDSVFPVITRLDPAGRRAIYSAALGTGHVPASAAFDPSGSLWVTGFTRSPDLPTTPNAIQRSHSDPAYGRIVGDNATRGGIPSSGIVAFAVHPMDHSTVFAAGHDGIWKSIDSGVTWSQLPTSLRNFTAVAIDPRNPNLIFAGTRPGAILKSSDSGESWQPLDINVGRPLGVIGEFAFHPAVPDLLFAATQSGVIRSTDAGATWTASAVAYNSSHIAIDPASPHNIFITVSPGFRATPRGLFVSADGGRNFEFVPLTQNFVDDIVFDPTRPGVAYASEVGMISNSVIVRDGLNRSTDSGRTWTRVLDDFPSALHISPAQPGILFVLMADGRVLRSGDLGDGFDIVSAGFETQYPLAAAVSGGGAVHVGSLQGEDAFVMKYSSVGEIDFVSYFGGQRLDAAASVATDAAGNAYIAGRTSSSAVPLRNALRSQQASGEAFLAKFNPEGELLYSTLLGGSGYDEAMSVSVGPLGEAIVAGWTTSRDLPLARAIEGPPSVPPLSGFIAKFAAPAAPAVPFALSRYRTGYILGWPGARVADSSSRKLLLAPIRGRFNSR